MGGFVSLLRFQVKESEEGKELRYTISVLLILLKSPTGECTEM